MPQEPQPLCWARDPDRSPFSLRFVMWTAQQGSLCLPFCRGLFPGKHFLLVKVTEAYWAKFESYVANKSDKIKVTSDATTGGDGGSRVPPCPSLQLLVFNSDRCVANMKAPSGGEDHMSWRSGAPEVLPPPPATPPASSTSARLCPPRPHGALTPTSWEASVPAAGTTNGL